MDKITKNGISSYREFCCVHEKYAPMLFAFVYAMCKSKHEAEEIVQDTFTKLWINREKIDPQKSIKNLIFTIAKNRFVDLYRRRINDPVFVDYLEHLSTKQDNDERVASALDFDEFRKQLEEAKKDLSPRQREIFELCKEQGFTSTEVAQRLGISEQVVYNQTSQAVKKLRERMGLYRALFTIFFF